MKMCRTFALLLGLTAVVTLPAAFAARASTPTTCHAHATVSDPEKDCLLCAGSPAAHVRAVWSIQKQNAALIRARLL
jgi:hypothetical protein